MKKRLLSIIMATIMVVSVAVTFTACGNSNSKNVTLNFMYGGNSSITEIYGKLIKEFNETVGKKQGITVQGSPKSSSIGNILSQQLPTKSGPDIVSVSDDYFKINTQYLEDMSGNIDQSILDAMYPTLTSRYRYNISTTTSNSDDPLYGVPMYNSTTVLYYNKTVLEELGVICISVDAEDMDAFNAGEKDLNGKTKRDYGITTDVPCKGFYRSESPYISDKDEPDGSSWTAPGSDEVLIFNDRIAMNWDEIEDIGMICTKDKNSDSPSQYGYYTEWWFNYGWSVGGDCLEDLSGKGDWVYSLAGTNPNYIVQPGKTYTGVYTGTVYTEGDALDVKDIIAAQPGDTISYDTDEESYFEYTVNGESADMRDFSAEVANGTLVELPAISEAFSRFCYLAGQGGLNVCPYPSVFNGSSATVYFTSGTLAFLVEELTESSTVEKTMRDEWGIAPLPQYKQYETPSDPDCDTVAVEGVTASHSMGYCISINQNSDLKDASYVFVEWIATEGQKYLAENGHLSARMEDEDAMLKNLPYTNNKAVVESAKTAKAGDWWYMPDKTWIDTWATPLNSNVRYGKMTLEEMLYGYIEDTQERLAEYKQ